MRDDVRERRVGKYIDLASFIFDGLDKVPPDGVVHNRIDERSDVSREAHGYSTGSTPAAASGGFCTIYAIVASRCLSKLPTVAAVTARSTPCDEE